VPGWQQTNKKLFNFFWTISEIGDWKGTVLLAAVTFNIVSKPAALYFWVSGAFMLFGKTMMKTWYAEPRPYFVTEDITPAKCHTDFGNPSGHMVTNTFLICSLMLHKYHDIGIKQERMSIFCTGYIIKMALQAICCIYIIFMCFSRIFLGAHTYNQVIFGTMVGALMAFIYHY
jgi:membrane-associated phospholipid phosphatase